MRIPAFPSIGLALSCGLLVLGGTVRAEVPAPPDPAALCALLGPCGDVNASGAVTSGDALLVLREAVGQVVSLQCAASGFPAYAVPPKTGQTECYDEAGVVQECEGSGQDGESTAGAEPLFSDSGDGTIRDKATGLVWEVLERPDAGSIHSYNTPLTWQQAFAKVTDLNAANFAGHDDWRLPNIRELQTLVDFGVVSPAARSSFASGCVANCSAFDCSCTYDSGYWSSTTFLESPDRAWVLDFFDGDTIRILKNDIASARAVRGGIVTKSATRASTAAAGLEPACSLVDPCGDVNASGTVTASDSLAVLQAAVGQPVVLQCRVASATTSAEILKTGQTTCYDFTGSSISCSGTGQDGELRFGVGTFLADNGDGTISDEGTGLIWEKLDRQAGLVHDKDTTYTWSQAFDKIDALNAAAFAGHTDWRLPNQRELHTLIDFGRNLPAVAPAFDSSCEMGCTVATCSCTLGFFYWTSTSTTADGASAWVVDFYDGFASGHPKAQTAGVRAVRGGLAAPLF